MNQTKYLNPYVGGVLLGLTLLAANFIAGRGLGASGAMKSVVIEASNTLTPSHSQNATFYKEYNATHPEGPMNSWLVFQVAGVLVGGFVSGIIHKRMKLKIEHSPKITSRKRLILAAIGGALFGFGSQMGRGCTSGSALSGLAVMSVGGLLTMVAIFATGYAFAWFFRKNWI